MAEMAGGRVVLVDYDASDAEVDTVFQQTNGVLMIGGGAAVPRSARRFYHNMAAVYASGDSYPIWGTCDGFEWLLQIIAADDGVLKDGFDSENMSLPLNFTSAAKQSRLLADAKGMPIQGTQGKLTIFDALATQPLTLNNHHLGVTPADFASNKLLPSAVTVLATNMDKKGREFLSLFEGRGGLPVWATQFHPRRTFLSSRARFRASSCPASFPPRVDGGRLSISPTTAPRSPSPSTWPTFSSTSADILRTASRLPRRSGMRWSTIAPP